MARVEFMSMARDHLQADWLNTCVIHYIHTHSSYWRVIIFRHSYPNVMEKMGAFFVITCWPPDCEVALSHGGQMEPQPLVKGWSAWMPYGRKMSEKMSKNTLKDLKSVKGTAASVVF